MQYVELVAILAVLQFFFFGFRTGMVRRESGLQAPATSGAESFERMYRVQTNTMETLVAFLPALFISGKYWPPIFVAAVGLVYIVGRFLYWLAYMKEPSKRGTGFILSMLPTLVLIIMALLGVLMTMIRTSA